MRRVVLAIALSMICGGCVQKAGNTRVLADEPRVPESGFLDNRNDTSYDGLGGARPSSAPRDIP
jgi:hypothetical protein